jgi:aspartate-semialdehyde dehydrogenase
MWRSWAQPARSARRCWILAQRRFPVGKVYPLASERSVGKTVSSGARSSWCENLANFDFSACRSRLFSPGPASPRSCAHRRRPPAAWSSTTPRSSATTTTSRWWCRRSMPHAHRRLSQPRHHRQPELLDHPDAGGAEADHDAVGIERINVATYQAVSGTGKEAVEELARQTASLLNGKPVEIKVYPSRSPSTCCRTSTSSRTTATPRKR